MAIYVASCEANCQNLSKKTFEINIKINHFCVTFLPNLVDYTCTWILLHEYYAKSLDFTK